MAMKPKTVVESEVKIDEINLSVMEFCFVGVSPLVPHAVSFKSKGQLLYPSKKKNQAEKDSSMKHEPYEEFRDAAYKFRGDDHPTRLYMPGGAFHGAMSNAAIDMVGAKKAQIGRLTNVVGDKINVWGVPKIICSIVRSSDMARTPDVRTLPILPRWCGRVTIQFVGSLIKPASIGNLLGAAGVIIGIGDGRPEKGKLSFGKFRICESTDPEFVAVMKAGGRKPQDEALDDPQFYDAETEEILSWFTAEIGRRVAAPAKERARTNGRSKRGEASPPALA